MMATARRVITVSSLCFIFLLSFSAITNQMLLNKDKSVVEETNFATKVTQIPPRETAYPPPPSAPQSDYFLGAYYMPKENQMNLLWHSLRVYNRESEYYRKPLLNYYPGNDVQAMDTQIKWAVENGLNYFIFDEFWTYSQSEPVYDDSLNSFRNASFKNYMNFAVMLTEVAASNQLLRQEKLTGDIANRYANEYFADENYLRINGRPVVYIYNGFKVFGINVTNNPALINQFLLDFNNATGEDIFWVYVTPLDSAFAFQKYKQAGFDMVAPYYVAPDITVNVDPNNVLTHNQFIQDAYNYNVLFTEYAEIANIKYVSSLTPNFDERNLYAVERLANDQTRYTLNPSLQNFDWYLGHYKDFIDGSNSSSIQYIDGKPMINIGAWNEIGEGSYIEPSFGEFSQNNPFALLNLIRDTFTTVDGVRPPNYYPLDKPVFTIPDWDYWQFGDSNVVQYTWHAVNMTDLVPNVSNTMANFTVDEQQPGRFDFPVNLSTKDYDTLRLRFGATCDGFTHTLDCVEAIAVALYPTRCLTDHVSSCEDVPVVFYSTFIGIDLELATAPECTVAPDNFWVTCDIYMAQSSGSIFYDDWAGRLELVNIYFDSFDLNPTHYSIMDAQFLYLETPPPAQLTTNLEVEMTGNYVDGSIGVIGDHILWTISLTNSGQVPTTPTQILITIPDALHIFDIVADCCTITVQGQQIILDVPSIEADQIIEIEVLTTIYEQSPTGTFTLLASILGNGASAEMLIESGTVNGVDGLPKTGYPTQFAW